MWTRQFGTPSPAGVGEAISGLAVDANGEHVYAVGTTSPTVPGEGAVSIPFIRKYDAAGNEVWTRQPETSITFSSGADGVALENAGDIYVAGTVSRRDPSFGDPIFIQKYDPAGQVLWSREFGGGNVATDSFVSGIAADNGGGVYVSGLVGSDTSVRRFDATTGDIVWSTALGQVDFSRADSIAVDQVGGVHVAGLVNGDLPGQTGAGGTDAFVRRFDAATGAVVSTRQFGTSASDTASAVATQVGKVYVAGSTGGTFPGQTNAGGVDAFVGVLAANRPPQVEVTAGGLCTNRDATGVINVTVTDPETAAASLTIAAVSSAPDLLSEASMVFGGQDAVRTLSVTPAARRTGVAVVTITVSDGEATDAVNLTVTVGGNGNDALIGTPGPDLLLSQNGNDTASALAGVDLLCGGNGNDVLNGGADDDTIFGGVGNDRLTGGQGADWFSGGPGNDTVTDFSAANI